MISQDIDKYTSHSLSAFTMVSPTETTDSIAQQLQEMDMQLAKLREEMNELQRFQFTMTGALKIVASGICKSNPNAPFAKKVAEDIKALEDMTSLNN